jgi:replicative DNA helicase
MGELYRSGAKDVPVWSLDQSLRYVRRHLTHVFSTGRKPVFRVRLASGKEVRATANHPFLTYEGWAPIGDLEPGARIATPRHVMAPELTISTWDDDQVVGLAQHIGDDSNFLPVELFSLPKRQISLFLRHLWASGGSVSLNQNGRGGVGYVSQSRTLMDDIARLLLRFGISSRLRTVPTAGHLEGYRLDLPGVDDQRRFLNEIGVHGMRGESAARLLAALDPASASPTSMTVGPNPVPAGPDLISVDPNPVMAGPDSMSVSPDSMSVGPDRRPVSPTADTVPQEIWDRVRGVLAEQEPTDRELADRELATVGSQVSGGAVLTRSPSRQRLGTVAELLGDADLEMYAVNDVLWDTVLSIEPDGEEEVFDATVIGTHNFIANGIAVHNSIEQDADIVILLHREDAYEKESPRAGEADFIVAKHRNGPTDTITVAFQGHYSRFVDMAT